MIPPLLKTRAWEGAENEVIKQPLDSPCTKGGIRAIKLTVSLQLDSPYPLPAVYRANWKTISPCTNFCDTNKDVVIDVSGRARGRAAVCIETSAGIEGRGRRSVTVVKVARRRGRPWARDGGHRSPTPRCLPSCACPSARRRSSPASAGLMPCAGGRLEASAHRLRAYDDTYTPQRYAASQLDSRTTCSLPKFLAAGNGLRFYDLRGRSCRSAGNANRGEGHRPSKAPTREQVRNYVHERAMALTRTIHYFHAVIDPDEFFSTTTEGDRLGPSGRRADRPMEERREHLKPQARRVTSARKFSPLRPRGP